MAYRWIIFKKKNRIGYITLNRPDRLNALGVELEEELEHAFQEARHDSEVDVIIVTGAGRAFCAGADLKDTRVHAADIPLREYVERWGQHFFDILVHFEKPTIAAVNGVAVGGGFQLALFCDIIVASETATLGQVQVTVGLIPTHAGTVRLARAVGTKLAMEMILTGKQISAEEAYRIGLVNRVVPAEQVMSAAEEIAAQIISRPFLGVRATKEALVRGLEMPLDEAAYADSLRFYILEQTKDSQEAHQAFREKRKGVFEGR